MEDPTSTSAVAPPVPDPFAPLAAAGFGSYLGFLRRYTLIDPKALSTDPLDSVARMDALDTWERVRSELGALRCRSPFRPSGGPLGSAWDVARRSSVLAEQLDLLDLRLDETYGAVPPIRAVLDVLHAQADLFGASSGFLVRAAVSTRTDAALRTAPKRVRARLEKVVSRSVERSLADWEVRVTPPEVPVSQRPGELTVDESWAGSSGWTPPGRRLPVPARVLSPAGYEVFATLCKDGMDRLEASEAASRLASP